jgi:hypothetical protein
VSGGSLLEKLRRALAAAVCLGAIVWGTARPAAALAPSPSDTSDDLFRRGRAAAQTGDCRTALPLFEQSQRLEPAVGTLLNLAVCEEKLGLLAAARAHLSQALALAPTGDVRRALIQERMAKLDVDIGRAGDARPVAASAPPTAPPAGQHPSTPSRFDRKRAGHLLLGAGAAAVAASLAAGAVVLHEKAEVEVHCPQSACDGEGLTAAHWGNRASLFADVTAVLGLAGLASSAYLLLTVPEKPGGPALVAITGSF